MARVRELYLDEFSDQYQSLLLGLELAPFASPDEAADILNILSHPTDSPLLRLFQAVAEETRLGAETTEDEDLEEQATAAAQTAFENLIGVGDRPRPNAGRSRNTLEERFEWVAELVAGEPSSAPIQHVLSLLEELYRFMVQMSNETGARGDIPANVAERGRSVVQQLEVEAGRQPPMLAGLLTTAASRSQSLAFSGVSAHVNNEWRSGPLPFCRNAIMGRYPIATDTTRDISLNDFGAFFGPGGELDSFFDEYLADYVNRSASPWRMRGAAGTPINISANALRQFERAALIRDTFFQGGGRMPAVLFELQPLYMDPEIRLFTLALGGDPGGRRITYSFGPDLVEYVEWPGSQPNAEVRVEVTPPTTNGVSMMREVGPWAWFRVLDRAVMRPGPMADKFEIEFDLDGRPILYELTIRGAYNPFRMVELEQFSCPESL
jgi:type VI secretion system protein ImpL